VEKKIHNCIEIRIVTHYTKRTVKASCVTQVKYRAGSSVNNIFRGKNYIGIDNLFRAKTHNGEGNFK
jgi:hypothetical protein